MTLNIWRYYDWNSREGNIVNTINDLAPDCIGLQEVQTNHAFSPWPQSSAIADSCGFKYRIFAPAYKKEGQIDKDGGSTQDASYGLAFMSKYPIISSESYFLRQHPDYDEPCSVLFVRIDIDGREVDICNVHFGNSDLFSDLHLNELMNLCEERNLKPIIIGDFNNFDLASYKATRLRDYMLSSDVTTYESMPKNKGTLDYIIVPSKDYRITSITCPQEYLSDHRAVFAKIERIIN